MEENRKTIKVGRVKGSMVYSGTDFQVEHPLENDLYLHSVEYNFYQYKNGEWIKVADLEEHSLEVDEIKIATSDNYNANSDNEIPTSKAINLIVKKQIDDKILSSKKDNEEYVDGKIDQLVGEGASETLDTIGEISQAIEANEGVIKTLVTKNEIDEVIKQAIQSLNLYDYYYTTNPYVLGKTLFLSGVYVEDNTLYIREAEVEGGTLIL